MERFIILTMVFSVLFCSCVKEENNENVSDNVVTESPVPGDVAEIDYAANSNNYWRDELRRQKKDIDTIVNWLKGIDYCDSIAFYKSDLSTLPDDEETREKIQNESNYETIKEIIIRNEYDIVNNWFSDRRIIIAKLFFMNKQIVYIK